MARGRPTEQPAVVKQKRVETYYEVPSKPELGWKSVWHHDSSKSTAGPWKTEHTPPKGWKAPKVKVVKNQSYGGMPIVMVFKTSNRSNAQTKLKTFRNRSVDEVLMNKLPGVPEQAVILEVGVGSRFADIWRQKYKL